MARVLKKDETTESRVMKKNYAEIARLIRLGRKTRDIKYKGQPLQTIDASREITITMSSFAEGVGKTLLINEILSMPGVYLADATEFSAYVNGENGDVTESITVSVCLTDLLDYISSGRS